VQRDYLREFSEYPVLVDLVRAVLYVNLKVIPRVPAHDLWEAGEDDGLSPALLEVGEEALGTLTHRDHVAKQDAVVTEKSNLRNLRLVNRIN
jgi:hypothetical protein